jgi:hypothetical protein
MTDDPFLALIVETLNLMHPRFAAGSPAREFYHQFRRLWDKALPVRLGLGHILIRDEPGEPVPDSCFLVWQIGEQGQSDRRLGAVSLAPLADSAAVSLELDRLTRLAARGYLKVVCVLIGHAAEVPEGQLRDDAVARILFDVDRWSASIIAGQAGS